MTTRPKDVRTTSLTRLIRRRQPVKLGSCHVNQRKSSKWADMQSWTCYLLEARVHQQLDICTLKRPRKFAQIIVARGIIAGHRNRVAPERTHDVGHLVEVAEHGNSVDDWLRQFLGWQADTNDLHSRVRLSLNPLDELLSRQRASSHDHAPDVPALPLQSAQKLPGKDASQQAQYDRYRSSDHNHAE